MQKKHLFSLALITSTIVLSGCDSLRNTFGLDHYQADEFKIPSNPPLSMPPDFNLRPPIPGASNRGEIIHAEKAQEKVLGKKVSLPTKNSKTEKSILKNASKNTKVDPNIRSEVTKDAEYDQTIIGKLSAIKDEAVTNLTTSKGTEGAVTTGSKENNIELSDLSKESPTDIKH